ncbi:hypothetical protein D3C85_1477710 [compost metagenome]
MPATLAEAEQLMDSLANETTDLKQRLDRARGDAAAGKGHADNGWYHRANARLRYLNHDRQRLMEHMAKLRREEKRAVGAAFDRLLLAELRHVVRADIFETCVARARIAAGRDAL